MSDDESEDQKHHIIIDNGSCYIKAGFSGEEYPRIVFPTVVGYPKYHTNKKEFFVGTDAEKKWGVLKLNKPIQRGEIINWDDMENIWNYLFKYELRAAPEEHNVMITELLKYPKEIREKIAQLMFESFNVPGLFIVNPAILSLYDAGKYTGFVVDLGHEISQFVPIYDGFPLSHAVKQYNFGGKDLTEYMANLLEETGMKLSTSAEKEIVKDIKIKSCYVALDYEEEIKSVEKYDYEMPDGTNICIKYQRIKCPESLFKPFMIQNLGDNIENIGQTCYDSIQKCNSDKKIDFYNCIVLSGGTSMFNGLPERFTKEIKALVPESIKEEVKVIASPERKFASWNGGSILSSISTFDKEWITKTEYEESGATIVHRKCLC